MLCRSWSVPPIVRIAERPIPHDAVISKYGKFQGGSRLILLRAPIISLSGVGAIWRTMYLFPVARRLTDCYCQFAPL